MLHRKSVILFFFLVKQSAEFEHESNSLRRTMGGYAVLLKLKNPLLERTTNCLLQLKAKQMH